MILLSYVTFIWKVYFWLFLCCFLFILVVSREQTINQVSQILFKKEKFAIKSSSFSIVVSFLRYGWSYKKVRLNCENWIPTKLSSILSEKYTIWFLRFQLFPNVTQKIRVYLLGPVGQRIQNKDTNPCSWTTHVDNAILGVTWFGSLLVLRISNGKEKCKP